jgi:hypothetical protein
MSEPRLTGADIDNAPDPELDARTEAMLTQIRDARRRSEYRRAVKQKKKSKADSLLSPDPRA